MIDHSPSTPYHIDLSARLNCGAEISILQRKSKMVIELEVTPEPGQDISNTAWIKDNKLRVHLTLPAFLGLFQFMGLIVFGQKKRKFLGIF